GINNSADVNLHGRTRLKLVGRGLLDFRIATRESAVTMARPVAAQSRMTDLVQRSTGGNGRRDWAVPPISPASLAFDRPQGGSVYPLQSSFVSAGLNRHPFLPSLWLVVTPPLHERE